MRLSHFEELRASTTMKRLVRLNVLRLLATCNYGILWPCNTRLPWSGVIPHASIFLRFLLRIGLIQRSCKSCSSSPDVQNLHKAHSNLSDALLASETCEMYGNGSSTDDHGDVWPYTRN